MTELEQLNVTLQRQLDAQNARIDNVANKVDLFIAEAQQQREDMRRLQDRQDEDRRKHDADMRRLQRRSQGCAPPHSKFNHCGNGRNRGDSGRNVGFHVVVDEKQPSAAASRTIVERRITRRQLLMNEKKFVDCLR